MQDRRIPSMPESRRLAQDSASEDVVMKRKPPGTAFFTKPVKEEILYRWRNRQLSREIAKNMDLPSREAIEAMIWEHYNRTGPAMARKAA